MAVTEEDGECQVLALPITHIPTPDPADAIEIATETKKRAGHDFHKPRIEIMEANEFLWPGPDLRAVPGGDALTVACGPSPPRLFAQVRYKFLKRDQQAKSTCVKRTELPGYAYPTLPRSTGCLPGERQTHGPPPWALRRSNSISIKFACIVFRC
jgi:hypothetical protein